jgi:hypothetical protein
MGRGLVAGLLVGLVSRKSSSLAVGLVAGVLIAGLFALPFALGTDPAPGKQYFWEIMIPGSMVGLIVGYATRKFGAARSAWGGPAQDPGVQSFPRPTLPDRAASRHSLSQGTNPSCATFFLSSLPG